MSKLTDTTSIEILYFVNQKQAEFFICPLCHDVPYPKNAIEHKTCGRVFCLSCLKQWKGPSCYYCKAKDTAYQSSSLALINTMFSLIITCPHVLPQSEKCKWQGEWEKLETHTKECPHALIECPKKCGAYMKRPGLEIHLKTSCCIRNIARKVMHKVLNGKKYEKRKAKTYAIFITESIKHELQKKDKEAFFGVAVVLAEGEEGFFKSAAMRDINNDIQLFEAYKDNPEWLGVAFIFIRNSKKRENEYNDTSFPAVSSIIQDVAYALAEDHLEVAGRYLNKTAPVYTTRLVQDICENLKKILSKFTYGVNVFLLPRGTGVSTHFTGNYMGNQDGTTYIIWQKRFFTCYVIVQCFSLGQTYCPLLISELSSCFNDSTANNCTKLNRISSNIMEREIIRIIKQKHKNVKIQYKACCSPFLFFQPKACRTIHLSNMLFGTIFYRCKGAQKVRENLL
eukprot:TRINITY_DN1239_c0_g1_i1.p1 TRINITY_DN1239_c0_g1~~TRINITY_DN1239_c0_g1_i1.p1  ORF type:complete len:453 (-),score=18.13 TRINITY_DN1239_c0_g1_i1:590-1948(-)